MIAGLAILFALGAGSRAALNYLMNLEVPCDQPCRDSDSNCVPLQLRLELKGASARAGRTPRIWYRASLKNDGCDVYDINADFFHLGKYSASDQASKDGFFFRITDEDGKELVTPKGTLDGGGRLSVYGTTTPASSFAAVIVDGNKRDLSGVEPYDVDADAYPEMFKKLDERDHLLLEPGETLIGQPTKYWPNRVQLFEVSGKDYTGSGSGKFPVVLKRRIAPDPPAGFRLLNRLVFMRAGRYRLQFALGREPSSLTRFRFQRLPKPLVRWLLSNRELLGVVLKGSRHARTHADSESLEIVVTP